MTTLWISAGLKVSPNKSANYAKSALLKLQKNTINEPDCIFFDVLQHTDSPNQFTLWEEWTNENALINHFNQAHTKAFLDQQLTEILYIEKLVKLT